MPDKHEYVFSDEARKAYERLLLPIGVYQLVGDRVKTLLASDGLCTFYGRSREDLVRGFNEDMFANVHLDDVEMLARLGLRYATQEGPYDIIYRSKLPGKKEYRYVHAVSRFHGMEDGSRVAFTMYADITETLETKKELEKEFNSPAVNFLNENMGPMAVVTRDSHRILFYNNAITSMLRPKVHYDSGLTFEEFFCQGNGQGFEGLFEEIDSGLQTVTEPLTGRRLAANVIACTWEKEPAYAVFLYEDAEEETNPEAAERHRRVAFHNIIYSGNYNGLEYYENGYRGMWIWNLTQDRMVAQSGHSELMRALGEEASFDRVVLSILAKSEQDSVRNYLSRFNRMECISRFRKGTFPTKADVRLNTPRGRVMLHLESTIMESPVDGDLYLKITEENITDRLETSDVLRMMVANQYDLIVYIDAVADHCRIIDGNTGNSMQKDLSVSFRHYAKTLSDRVCMHCRSAEELTASILRACGSSDDAALTYEQPDGKVKNIKMHILNRKNLQFFISKTDVTSSFVQEQEQLARIETARLEAERANEAKSAFLSSMSHDMRTPLNGVLSFTAFALKEQDPEKKQEYLKKIDASGKLLMNLINDTLDLSRIESGKVRIEEETVSSEDLIPAVVTALRPSAELRNIRLETDFSSTQPHPVRCDRLKVQKIALNLISNAIKYTPEGGTIRVGFTKAPADMPGCARSLVVEDNGIGMSREFMEHMYEPFTQEKRSESVKTPGTGLGLAIVKRYVDLMGGRIDVTSELHKGTRWVVTLPVQESETILTKEAGLILDEAPLRGKRVLLCEDNFMNTEIASMLLTEKGMEVETAGDGKAGLDLFLSSAAGYYDAVLMDIRMPVMDGLTAVRQIRSSGRPDADTVPVIAMTAEAFEESIHEAADAGMNDYITKPIDPKTLFSVLRRHI